VRAACTRGGAQPRSKLVARDAVFVGDSGLDGNLNSSA